MSIKATVKVFATLRDYMDKETVINLSDRTTIAQLLDLLTGRYPGIYVELFDSPGKLKPFINILKNGRNVAFIKDMDTTLDDGDIIAIFPPVAGG